MTNSNKIGFWTIFGKFATVVASLWAITQLYNYYIRNEYKVLAKGSYFAFDNPPDVRKIISDYVDQTALDNAYGKYFKDDKKIDSIKQIDDLIKSKINDYGPGTSDLQLVKIEFEYLRSKNENLRNVYKSNWRFIVKNEGVKPLEDLILELPFDGLYELSVKNENPVVGKYKSNINIGNLKPTYEVHISVWSDIDVNAYPEYNENKTRIVHKFGWQSIEYPQKVTGFLAWIAKSEFSYLILFIILFLILFFVFHVGWLYGPVLAEADKKIKLKEFKELEKLSRESQKDGEIDN